MFVAGIVLSAVAMLLGIFTKLPQGGGGLTKNLMALSFFLPAPPLSTPPPRNGIIFDLETAIAKIQIFTLKNPVVTRNGTQESIPPPLRKSSIAAGSGKAPADNITFAFPAFSLPEFSLPLELLQYWESISTIVMILMSLGLPWLIIKRISLLGKTGPAFQAASTPSLIGLGELVAKIEPPDPLYEDLKLIISERNQALAELQSITKRVQEAERKAAGRDEEKEEELNRLRVERRNALAELEKEKEKAAKLEEERKRDMDGLREDTSSQMKAWTEKEKKWEEDRAKNKKRHVEAVDSLNMGRERERESWRRQVEDMEEGEKRAKEAFRGNLKNIHERMKKEREKWGNEKETWRKEREVEAAEKKEMASREKELEEKRDEEKKSWDEANDRAQRRIADLEEENRKLKDEAAERQKNDAEAEAASKAAEAEEEEGQRRSLEEAQSEGRKTIAKLGNEVLNGRKLIEDLQGDKRRDRQMLLELRAQLVRPSNAVPPSHVNPLRFGGSASRFMGPPAIADPSAFPYSVPPAFPTSDLPSSGFAPLVAAAAAAKTPLTSPKKIVRLPSSAFAPPPVEAPPTFPKPIVRLPSRTPPNPFPLPTATSTPPPNAPKGPKSGPSGPLRRREGI